MKQFYENYWSTGRPPPVDDPLTPSRRKCLWAQLGDVNGVLRLLDCGSGEGHLTAEAVSKGVQAVGMELSATALALARMRYPDCTFVGHSVEERPWPVDPASFDVCVAFELIEHLLNPRELLRGAYEVLKPGGHIALTTPYHGRIKDVIVSLLAFERHFDVDGAHIRFFTDSALRWLLEDEGFRVERILHYGRFWPLWSGVFAWARKP